MRFEGLEIERFGALRDRVLDLGGKSAAIFGPNEAGKSQMREAMRSLLCGFRPTRFDRHPARPVDGGEVLSLAATVRRGDQTVRIERVLDGGGARSVGSLPLPIRAEVYDDLFVIGPDEVARFHAEPTRALRALILGDGGGGPGVDSLRRSIDRDRARIWRPDRRAKSTDVLEVDRELERIQGELRAARAVESRLVDLEDERVAMGVQLRALEGRRAAVKERRNQLETLERTARAVRAAAPPSGVDPRALAALPEDATLPSIGPLLAELDAAEDACVHPQERLAEPECRLTESHRRILQGAEEIEALCRLDPEAARLVAHAGELRAKSKALRVRARAQPGSVIAQGGGGALIPVGIGVVAVAAGLAAYAAPGPGIAAGAAVLGVVAAGGAPALARRVFGRPGQGQGPSERNELEADAASAEELAASSERQAAAIDAQLAILAEAAGLGVVVPRGIAPRLRAALAEAQRGLAIVDQDRAEREQADRELRAAERRLESAETAVQAATAQLETLVPGERSPLRAHDLATTALQRREQRRGALAEIAADPARWRSARDHPDFDVALSEGRFDAAPLHALDDEERSLREAITRLRDGIARTEERLASERPGRPVSEARSEELALRSRRAALLDTHDRLALLGAVLAEGERRHRAAHAPALLRRASGLLAELTAGRWDRLELDDAGRVVVCDAIASWPVAPPLSRGLREEIHLCLRVAALDTAEDGAEPLPLLLDEPFAHWDDARRRRGLEMLAGIADGRQVIMFTCHREWADEAGRRLSIPVLRA